MQASTDKRISQKRAGSGRRPALSLARRSSSWTNSTACWSQTGRVSRTGRLATRTLSGPGRLPALTANAISGAAYTNAIIRAPRNGIRITGNIRTIWCERRRMSRLGSSRWQNSARCRCVWGVLSSPRSRSLRASGCLRRCLPRCTMLRSSSCARPLTKR